jgi:hypothetical protein
MIRTRAKRALNASQRTPRSLSLSQGRLRRVARPDPSLRKERLFRMTIGQGHRLPSEGLAGSGGIVYNRGFVRDGSESLWDEAYFWNSQTTWSLQTINLVCRPLRRLPCIGGWRGACLT